jgi:PAS domain-containing protein
MECERHHVAGGNGHVELFGIAKRQGRRCWLEYATVVSTSAVASESQVVVHKKRSATAAGESNRVVTLDATFWDSNTFNSDIVLSFDVDQSKLTCRLLGDLENRELPKLQRGAAYRITGLLNTVSVGELDTQELLVRSLSDVVQVSGPPWPVRFTLYIVSLLSAGLAVGLVSAVYSWKQSLVARQRLEIARNELRETNETLEARVAARTLELDRTNQRLLDEATARLLVENENANTLESLEDAQSLAQIGSFYWNATTNTSSWSKQSYLIHGLDPEQRSPGLDDYGDRVAEADRAAFQQYLERAAGSSEREECRYRITTPQGDVRWLRSLVRSIHDSSDSLTAMDGVFQDITEMVKAEEQLRQSMKMEVAGCMAGGIAHDLNNTLTIIRLNCYF